MKDKSGSSGDEEEAVAPALPPATVKAVFQFARWFDVALMLLGTITAIGVGLALPSFSFIFGEVLDRFNPSSEDLAKFAEYEALVANYTASLEAGLPVAPLPPPPELETNQELTRDSNFAFLYVGGAAFVLGVMQHVSWRLAASRQTDRMRGEFVVALLRQDMAFFDQHSSAALVSRLNSDLALVQKGIGAHLAMLIQYIATFLGGFGVGFWQGWELSLALCALVPLLAAAGAFMQYFASKMTMEGQSAYGTAGALLTECLWSVRTLLGLNAEAQMIARYDAELAVARKADHRKGWIAGLGNGMTWFLFFVSFGAAFRFGFWLVHNRDYTGGRVLMVLFAVLLGGFAAGQAGPHLQAFGTARASAAQILDVIEARPAIDALSKGGKKPKHRVRGRLRASRVRFSYPARPGQQVLRGLSLTIEAGQTVALVGESGCGKSTLLGLAQRLYDPDEGTITLDGVDLRDLNVAWLRRNMGVVGQEPVLYGGSIRDNIALGLLDDTDIDDIDDRYTLARAPGIPDRLAKVPLADIERAAKSAFAHDFIMSFPDGYDTYIGETGAQLSGGQKQRIAIARAILKDPPILLLDEATSALDTKSEKIVQRALERASKGRTTLTVAHRLSTIRDADVIVVFDQGKVLEKGTHDELLAKKGSKYAALWTAQQSTSKKEDETSSSSASSASASASASADDGKKGGTRGGDDGDDDSASSSHSSSDDSDDEGGMVDIPLTKTQKKKKEPGNHDDRGTEDDEEEEEEEEEEEPSLPMGRLLAESRSDWWLLVVGFVGAVMSGVIMPSFSLAFAEFISLLYEPEDEAEDEVDVWFGAFFGVAGVALVGYTIQLGGFGSAGARMTMRLRSRMFRTVLNYEMAWFDRKENEPNAVAETFATQAALVHNAVGPRMGTATANIVTIVTSLSLAFWKGPLLTLIVLATVPLMAIGSLAEQSLAKGMDDGGASGARAVSGARVAEAVVKIRTTVAFTRERALAADFLGALRASRRSDLRAHALAGFASGWAQGITIMAYAPVMFAGAWLADQPEDDWKYTSFKDVMTVFFAIAMMGMAVGESLAFAPDMAATSRAVGAVFAILDRVPTLDTHDTAEGGTSDDFSWRRSRKLAAMRERGISGAAALRDASFTYPTRPGAPVFGRMDLDIPEGATVALVGPSGSGKSSAVQLLQRFYDLDSGKLLLAPAAADVQKKGGSSRSARTRTRTDDRSSRSHRRRRRRRDGDDDAVHADDDSDDAAAATTTAAPPSSVDVDASAVGDDAVDVRDVPTRWLRRQIGVVGQEPVLFNGTIAENLRMGNPDLSDRDMRAACRDAQALAFIERFPDGFETQVGAGGGHLSGGQKQRIVIARAIARKPRLLLLDEATSALDSQSESKVQVALDSVMRGFTTVVVAHRLSTIRNADKIVVMAPGGLGIAEQGTHQQLMDARKAYYSLVQQQER